MVAHLFIAITFLLAVILNSDSMALGPHGREGSFVEVDMTITTITTIQAEQGFKWRKGEGDFSAHGNVCVHRGYITLSTDSLAVFSHKSNTKLSWWHGVGNTRIVFPMGTLSGETADYNVHDRILSLNGHPVHLETATETLTARKGLEYHEEQQIAVAHGDVHVVTPEGSIVRMDVAIISLKKGKQKTAFGENIMVKTQKDVFFGECGIYNLDTGIAVVKESVQMVTKSINLTGERVVVNTKTGLSRLYSVLQNKRIFLKMKMRQSEEAKNQSYKQSKTAQNGLF